MSDSRVSLETLLGDFFNDSAARADFDDENEIPQVAMQLRSEILAQGKSFKSVADAAGMHASNLSRVLDEGYESEVQFSTLQRIARTLGKRVRLVVEDVAASSVRDRRVHGSDWEAKQEEGKPTSWPCPWLTVIPDGRSGERFKILSEETDTGNDTDLATAI